MLAAYVEPVVTPIPFDQAVPLMRWAIAGQLSQGRSVPVSESEVPDGTLALALAKVWLETGRGLHCWNGNWGNVKAAENYRGMFTCITLNEVLKGVVHWFAPQGELSAAPSKGGRLLGAPLAVPDGHPQTRMRALANHTDGVDSYVDFVAHGRYHEAWQHLLTGSAQGYVHALKAANYFTADEGAYMRGVVALRDELLARLRNLPPAPAKDLDWVAMQHAVPGIQFDLAALKDTGMGLDFVED